MYGTALLINYNRKVKEWHKQLTYRLLKSLFKIRTNPPTNLLLETVYGTSFDHYQDLQATSQMIKLID